MAKRRKMRGLKQRYSPWRKIKIWWRKLPVKSGWLALGLLNLAVLLTGVESAWVQTATTHRIFSWGLLGNQSFWLLLCLDIFLPLTVALLSRRAFFVYLAGQCFLSTILLHYTIFFYNPLTLASIYHSMQGAASLGIDIFGFARPDIIVIIGALFVLKVLLVQMSRLPDRKMPRFWQTRGITAVGCLTIIWMVSNIIYGKTGLTVLWIDSQGHRTATERRLEEGTREAVRNIGYIGTWFGEWLSGTYKDTDLIYAEARCPDPDLVAREFYAAGEPESWMGLPFPPTGNTVVLLQVESLDFEALGMTVNGHQVTPFLNLLSRDSLVLKTFAPHKDGSSNSDYEILNARLADQNVIYYSYIREYPDSVIHQLAKLGYEPSIFHGLNGNLFNLREAYTAQGFQHLYFKEELLESGYGASQYIMEHIKDEDVLDMAASHLAQGGKQAQFIITMSTHIPFIKPMAVFKSAGGSFARYVSSLRYFDQCLAAYYAQLPAGTVLILWGDHGSDVIYPRGFADNARHVPFLVHVKEDDTWLQAARVERMESGGAEIFTGREQTGDAGVSGSRPNMEELAAPVHEEDKRASTARVFTLCELGYYLRRIFR